MRGLLLLVKEGDTTRFRTWVYHCNSSRALRDWRLSHFCIFVIWSLIERPPQFYPSTIRIPNWWPRISIGLSVFASVTLRLKFPGLTIPCYINPRETTAIWRRQPNRHDLLQALWFNRFWISLLFAASEIPAQFSVGEVASLKLRRGAATSFRYCSCWVTDIHSSVIMKTDWWIAACARWAHVQVIDSFSIIGKVCFVLWREWCRMLTEASVYSGKWRHTKRLGGRWR